MLKLFNFFILLASICSPLSAKENTILLEKVDNELLISYSIPNATEIKIDSHYNNLLVKNKTFTISKDGKFRITLNIKSETSREFYDPLRLYSNGEFLLYKDFLLPQKIIYKKDIVLDKKEDKYPDFLFLKNDNYIIGNRFVFWGVAENIKIFGLDKKINIKDEIFKNYENIFNYYTNNFGKIRKKNPIVVIDFIEDGGKFYYKGDALDNFLSYNISNISMLNRSTYYKVYNFISHEIFHIWNSYEHNHSGKSWLHEGSAEYFSMRSLNELGYIDKDKLANGQKAYLEACYQYYKENNKKIMNNNNSELSIYICGNSLHILLEKLENKNIVLDIWKELFKNGNYHSDDFFDKVKKHPSISAETKDKIYDFIYKEGGVTRTIEFLNIKLGTNEDNPL